MNLNALTRPLRRPRLAPLYPSKHATPHRDYSTDEPVLKVRSVPAPHCGRIKILELNRAHARNALSKSLVGALSSAIETVYTETSSSTSSSGGGGGAGSDATRTRAVILASGRGSSFCAGADLKERASFTAGETRAFLSALRATLGRLAGLDAVPTLAAVSGAALGGGLELALATHLRVFGSRALVGLPETRLGIVPGAGGSFRLPALIGEARARDLIVSGRRIGAPEAFFLGLCDRVVEVADEGQGEDAAERARVRVLDAAVGVAREICEGAPLAVTAALGAVRGWRDGQEGENRWYDSVVGTEDRNEALRAFVEKRAPVFKGR